MSSSLARRKTDRPAGSPLQEAYIHLTSRRHSTSTLAAAMRISTATAFRLIQALRRKGHRIVSMKEGARWFFVLEDKSDPELRNDPLVRARGLIRSLRRPRGKPLNDAIDEELYGNP